MGIVTIIATINAKENKKDFVKEELIKLIKPTLEEKGCIEYKFYQDTQNLNYFKSYEKWETEEDVKNHLQSKHIKQYFINTQNSVEEFYIQDLVEII